MAIQLYPPKISSILPAFCYNPLQNYDELTIQYSPNISVNKSDYTGFVLQLKDFTTNNVIGTFYDKENKRTKDTITFHIYHNSDENNTPKLSIGQFYRVQIAYYFSNSENTELKHFGIFSTTGTIKYTVFPQEIGIEKMFTNSTNYLTPGAVFKGVYERNPKDITETPKSYSFTVYDENYNVFETTGEKVYYANSNMEFKMSQLLDVTKLYYIQFSVTTINGLTSSSFKYTISTAPSMGSSLEGIMVAKVDNDNACIAISLEGEKFTAGTYLISRMSEKESWKVMQPMAKVTITEGSSGKELFTDFTVEHGIKYRYGIQQYNKYNIYSNLLETDEVMCNFEDSFLYDGEKQLKIRFNPQISSFKSTIQEQKVDTLGSQFPFFFKNGATNYKEFPINGLISYNMDEKGYFLPIEEDNCESSTNLSDYNMRKEREFKLAVLDWLNNGKIKLFKSAAEGNYIVRLMNTSLSPENGLSRMLHSFSSTAYEIKENNYNNLVDLGLINIEQYLLKNTIVNQVMLEANKEYEFIDQEVYSIKITDCRPGSIITFTFDTEEQLEVVVGLTGSYFMNNPHAYITKIKATGNCVMDYKSYSYILQSEFDKIKKIEFKDVVGKVIKIKDGTNLTILMYNNKIQEKCCYKNYLLEIRKIKEDEELSFKIKYDDGETATIFLPCDRVCYQVFGDDLNNIKEIIYCDEAFNVIWSYLEINIEVEGVEV